MRVNAGEQTISVAPSSECPFAGGVSPGSVNYMIKTFFYQP